LYEAKERERYLLARQDRARAEALRQQPEEELPDVPDLLAAPFGPEELPDSTDSCKQSQDDRIVEVSLLDVLHCEDDSQGRTEDRMIFVRRHSRVIIPSNGCG
jgi:hypothetical protein